MRTFAAVIAIGVVAACAPMSVQGLNETEFRESVVGHTLKAGPATIVVGADGTLSGSTSDGAITGTWQYKDDQFCREAKAGSRQLPYDCQIVLPEGNKVVFWRNRGRGVKAVYSITEISFQATTPATAQDLGDEWQSLTAAEWSIVFPAPGLDRLIERHQLSKNVDSSYRHEVAFWSGRASSYPKAVIHFMRTHSDIAWRTKPDLRSIGDEGIFKEKSVTFDSLKKDRNRLGRVEWRIFHFDNVNCVGFTQVWGDVDLRLAGDKMVIGYYCADPGKSLSEDEARKVVTAIDIADTNDWRRQLVGKSTGPFDGLWTGLGGNDSGICSYRGLGRSFKAFELEILVREQEITGHIKGLRNSYWTLFPVDVSVQGTVNENGELDLQVSNNNLSVDLLLQGKISRDGNKASGEWDAPNCHGTLTLTRKYPF